MKSTARVFQFAGGLLLAGLSQSADAALRWETTTIERTLPATAEAVELHFPFSNPENHPVSIVHLQPSCGCTTASLKKYTFAPGEKGELTVFFDGKGTSGSLQEKTIQVDLDDDPKPVTLTLRITMPAWAEVTPRLLWWPVGEEAKTKEAVITLNREADIRIAAVKVDNPAITASLKPGDALGKYRLIARPVTTARPAQTTITLTLELAGSPPRTYPIFAQVR